MSDKFYRALVVDPRNRTIEVVVTRGTLAEFHEFINEPDAIDSFRLADHGDTFDHGWVSDSGLVAGKPIHAFLFDKRKDPIAGRCFIIGVDEAGEVCDAKISHKFLKNHIEWLGLIKPEIFWDETERGHRAIVTYERLPDDTPPPDPRPAKRSAADDICARFGEILLSRKSDNFADISEAIARLTMGLFIKGGFKNHAERMAEFDLYTIAVRRALECESMALNESPGAQA